MLQRYVCAIILSIILDFLIVDLNFTKPIALANIDHLNNKNIKKTNFSVVQLPTGLSKEQLVKNLYNQAINQYKANEYRISINLFQEALVIYKEIQDLKGESQVMNDLAGIYLRINKNKEALDLNKKALKIRREIGYQQGELQSLISLGATYNKLSQYALAIETFKLAIPLAQKVGTESQNASLYSNLGQIFSSLGQSQEAYSYYEQALKIRRQIGDLNGEANTLHNLGFAYESDNRYDDALKIYQDSLAIRRLIGDKLGEAKILNNIGSVLSKKGKYTESIKFLESSLEIFQSLQEYNSTGLLLDSLAKVYQDIGKYKLAEKFYFESLIIKRISQQKGEEAITLRNLGNLFSKQGQIAIAIIFYKQSIQVTESIRKNLTGLDIEQQKSYTETVKDRYRELADLLLQQNRILEAQRVLDLLKVQELDEYLRGVRGNDNTKRGIENLPSEQQINIGYQKLVNQAVANGIELTELRRIKPQERTIAQSQRIDQLDIQETKLVTAFTEFINSKTVQTQLEKLKAIAFNQQDLIGRLSEFNALQDNLRNLQQNAVLLYPLILEDRLELILTTPDSPPIRRTVKVTSREINQAIVDFRLALENPRSDATKPAQKLYEWLIKPIEKDLNTAKAKTIIYAPDGQLRYIPLAALHDGKQWLTQHYRINHITAASLTDLNTKPQRQLSVLAGAYTSSGKQHNFAIGDESFNFTGLPFAEMEVTKLAETIPETTQLRNEDFSFKATKPKMDDYTIVHFATHAAFLKGQPEKSFILFGNGDRISLADIKGGAFGSLRKVDLFVLSACETGVGGNFGTGAEILGFGYLMQISGARAAIASLWRVSDGGTQALMNAFYASLSNNGIMKTEALRQAQVALITGDYKPLAGTRGNQVAIERRIREGLPNPVANNLSHPYYWAPFILIGNGL